MTTTWIVSPGRADAFCTSGPSPTLHLVGAGKVGRALLRLLPETRLRLVGLSDSRASVYDGTGLDAECLADFKAAGHGLDARPGAASVPTPLALSLVNADVVADCTDTRPARACEALTRSLAVLDSGKRLVLAAKDGLLAGPTSFLEPHRFGRVSFNAVLGGTGSALHAELADLRGECRSAALVANATTTFLIESVERGRSLEQSLSDARRAGVLEADPRLDLDGTDAALKLVIVASLLAGTKRELAEVELASVSCLDVAELRRRYRRGATTRLVARLHAGGRLALAFEELPRASTLAVPWQRVSYTYELAAGTTRVHLGSGIGPAGTARAVLADAVRSAGGAS